MTRVAQGGPETVLGEERSDPRQFFRVLWRRKWMLLLVVTLIPAAVYVYSSRLSEVYEASTVISVEGTASDSLTALGLATGAPTSNARIAAVVETDAVADEASRLLGEPEGSMRGAVTATDDDDTGFITIIATAASGERAATIANTFASALRATRARQGVRRIDAAIANVEKSLRELPSREVVQREQLSQNLQQLRTLRGVQSENAQVIQPARVPASPVSPNPKRNAVLSFVLALLIGAGVVALTERLDRRLHDPLDLERLTGTPLLARVPGSAFPGSAPDLQLPIVFQTLRDSLTYFNLDRPLTSLLIMSPLKGDGKTSVATQLAVAYARAAKRVVLVDADLRSPQVAIRMGALPSPGLTELLTGGAEMHEALQEIEPFGKLLRVLAAGSTPPNPSEMLGSGRMSQVLGQLAELCDLVILDTPPVLLVSDGFPLFDQVVGIVGVARLERTDRESIARAIDVTTNAGGRVLGMVATGGKADETGYGYGYGRTDSSSAVTPEPMPAAANGHSSQQATALGGRVSRRLRSR